MIFHRKSILFLFSAPETFGKKPTFGEKSHGEEKKRIKIQRKIKSNILQKQTFAVKNKI